MKNVLTALAAAAVVQASQMALWSSQGPAQIDFLAEHFALIAVAFVVLALSLGDRHDGRAWAAASFAFPVALSLWPGSLGSGTLGIGWALFVLVLASTGVFVWSRLPIGRGAPILSAVAGTFLGAGLTGFRYADTHDLGNLTAELAVPGSLAVLVLAAALIAGSRRAPTPMPLLRQPAAVLFIALITAAVFAHRAEGELYSGSGHSTSSAASEVASSGATAPEALPPVALIVLDTVRADHLKAYGYERDTMPKLERLMAEEGSMALRAVANSPYSLASHASLFTGLYPPRHGAHKVLVDDPDPSPSGLYPLGEDIPTLAKELVFSVSDNPIVILLMVNVVMILIGMVMDDISGLLLSAPLLLPIVTSVGMDPIHFAAVLGVNLGMANITPPTAPLLYLGARVTQTPVNKMIKPTLIMIAFAWLPTLIITTYLPAIALWLPELVFAK